MKAWAALTVGILSFTGIYLESRDFKLAAAAAGCVLPLLYLLFLALMKRVSNSLNQDLNRDTFRRRPTA